MSISRQTATQIQTGQRKVQFGKIIDGRRKCSVHADRNFFHDRLKYQYTAHRVALCFRLEHGTGRGSISRTMYTIEGKSLEMQDRGDIWLN
jgi:hypothetical protein